MEDVILDVLGPALHGLSFAFSSLLLAVEGSPGMHALFECINSCSFGLFSAFVPVLFCLPHVAPAGAPHRPVGLLLDMT